MPRASPRPRCALCRRSPSTRCASSGERNAVPPCQKVYRKRIMKRLVIVFSLLAALDRLADIRGRAKPALAAIPSDSDDDGRGLAPGFLDAADRVDRFAQPAQLLGGAPRPRRIGD